MAAVTAAGGMGKTVVAGRIVAAGRTSWGMLDLRRAMTGGRVRMMPLCGGATTAPSTGLSKVRWENIGGMLGKLVYVLAMCWRTVARHSGRKGGRRRVPRGVKIDVDCVC